MGVAFLLAQLGADAAEQFANALTEHDLTPALAGLMRRLNAEPGLNQLQLAERLNTAPSRIVAYLDDLEARGWITRTRDSVDRRVNVLALTDAGRAALGTISTVAINHEKTVTDGLDDTEHEALRDLLAKLVAARGLTPGVHPGYRHLPATAPSRPRDAAKNPSA
jgi:DNA-binding MarR family transcriptional regulator